MKVFTKWACRMQLVLSCIVMFAIASPANAADYKPPHDLKPGDIVSADIFNEIFAYMKNAQRNITPAELLGTWGCTVFYNASPVIPTISGTWTLSASAMYNSRETNITFIDNDNGTYSYSTGAPDGIDLYNANSGSGNWDTINNVLFISLGGMGSPTLTLKRISATRVFMESTLLNGPFYYSCDKQDQPPAIPTNLAATVNTNDVTLSWLDSSITETEFKVVRKDKLTGAYNLVATVPTNSTSHIDNALTVGDYWYRVIATSTNGDSLGSNVVKVTIP